MVNANLNLPAGNQTLQLVQDSGGSSLNCVTFTSTNVARSYDASQPNQMAELSFGSLCWTFRTGAPLHDVDRSTIHRGENRATLTWPAVTQRIR